MSEQRPNILLITTDQQRFDTLHAAGNPYIRTPHLDWLLESGIHYNRCYADAPVCVTSRATLITGKHWHNLRPYGNWTTDTAPDPNATLPALLTQSGYQTRAIGKMHYVPARRNYGWEHMEILQDYYRFMARHPERGVPMDHGVGQNEMEPVLSTVREEYSLTHWTVERSIEFLETRDTSRPFFLYTSFSKPHPPFDPCAQYWSLYQNATMPNPVYGDWSQRPEDIPPGFMESTWRLNGVDRFSLDLLRDVRRAYYALITQIDYNLGLLFARLRELGVLENTIILFTSDHGEMLGDHYMGAKSVFLEGSAHIPLIVRPLKGRMEAQRGSTCNTLANLADIMPTCLSAAGVSVPSDLEGLDLLAAADGNANRERLFGNYNGHYMVREGNLKYIYTETGGAELLFDIGTDPMELHNLLSAGSHADAHQRLRGTLAAHLNRPDGDLPLREGPLPDRRTTRRNSWPGLHTRNELIDVLH
jgi:arylsulfatase